MPCGFSYIAVRSDGKLFGPFNHRGRDAVYVFLIWLQNHEREMREDVENKRPLFMTPEDWKKHRKAVTATSATKAYSRTYFWTPSLCTHPKQENTADKVTEDAASPQ